MCSDERLCFQHKNMNWNRYHATRIVDTRLCGTNFGRYHEVSMTRQTHRPLGSKEPHAFPIDHFQLSIGNKRNSDSSVNFIFFEISFSPCFIQSLVTFPSFSQLSVSQLGSMALPGLSAIPFASFKPRPGMFRLLLPLKSPI